MTIDNMINYVTGGHAVFTLQSTKLDKRYTYKINADSKCENRFYANVLYGPDNGTDYRFLGFFYRDNFTLKASKYTNFEHNIINTDNRFRMLEVFLQILCTEDELPETCIFYPSGRCARCGRLLTTPESIESGFGPECIKHV